MWSLPDPKLCNQCVEVMSFDGISRMALEGHDSMQDVERLKRKNKWSRSEWLECKRHVEDKETERDYRQMLLMFYSCIEMPEYHKTNRGKFICIDDEDDSDEEYDHAYKLFLNSLMEQGETRPLKVDNGFSGYGFGMQTQLDNNACVRASMGPDKKQDVRGRKRVLSTRQYNLRTQASKSIRKTVGKWDEPLSQKTPTRNKKQMDRNSKGKNIFNVDHETSKKATVKVDKENFYQVRGGKNNYVTRDDCGQNYALKDEPDDGVETRFGRKIINKLRSGRTAKCLVEYKNDDDIVSEVNILDNALIETGILSPFVPSRRYDSTWIHADIMNPSCPAASEDEFRKEVLKVLRQPYDKEESKRYRAAIKAGSYLDHHRDLGKRLSKYRYKRGKCLALLRGFFFWLQNLTREGSFEPWRDRQCLAVEPPSC